MAAPRKAWVAAYDLLGREHTHRGEGFLMNSHPTAYVPVGWPDVAITQDAE